MSKNEKEYQITKTAMRQVVKAKIDSLALLNLSIAARLCHCTSKNRCSIIAEASESAFTSFDDDHSSPSSRYGNGREDFERAQDFQSRILVISYGYDDA